MIKDWLNFTKAERNGIVLIVFILCVVAVYPFFHQIFLIKPHNIVKPSTYYAVDSFLASLTSKEHPSEKSSFSLTDEEPATDVGIELFPFDPNTATWAELVRLGFSERQANVIINYRNRGGQFRVPSDFQRVYVVDSAMFSRLHSYIKISTQTIPSDTLTREPQSKDAVLAVKKEPEKIFIELNSADTLELTKLRGIGRGYARRIVAYRQLLGGYYSTNQLLEVYGFPENLLESIKPNIWVDSLKVNQLNINLINYQDLRRHPYLTDHQARSLIYYRETIGNITCISDIVENKLLDANTFNRIKHYLTLQ